MGKKITSNYQQGGITANTVNTEIIEQIAKVSPHKKRSWWQNPWLITVIGGIIATVTASIFLNQMSG